jgi:Ni/Fe-hydrogenase subunit HybB-like protein
MSQSQVLLSPFQLASVTVLLASSEDSDLRSPLALRFLDGRFEEELEMVFVVVVVVVAAAAVVVAGSSSSASKRTVFLSCLLLLLLLLPPAMVDLEAEVGMLADELMRATPLLLLRLRLRLCWR